MRPLVLSLVASVSLAAAPAAFADSYNFVITTADTASTPGTSFTTSGTITGPADPYAPAAFDINAVTGAASIYTFSDIITAATNSQVSATQYGFTFNNVLYTTPGQNHVDANGFLLYLTSPLGLSLAHVYYNAGATPGYEVDVIDPNDPGDVTPFQISSFDVTPSAVPEPSTLALLGTGLIGLAGVGRRRLFR